MPPKPEAPLELDGAADVCTTRRMTATIASSPITLSWIWVMRRIIVGKRARSCPGSDRSINPRFPVPVPVHQRLPSAASSRPTLRHSHRPLAHLRPKRHASLLHISRSAAASFSGSSPVLTIRLSPESPGSRVNHCE